jgi:predicted DNA-binding transcriptional regulator AlpA
MNLRTELLTAEELAAELRIHRRTLDRWVRLRLGPPRVKVGKVVRYRRGAIAEWLMKREGGR